MEIDPDYAILNGTAKDKKLEYLKQNKAGLDYINADVSTSGPSTELQTPHNSTVQKITDIIESQFSNEIEDVENDILEIDKRLNESRLVLDRLRASLLISYYDKSSVSSRESSGFGKQQQVGIHPAIKTEIGKSIHKKREEFASSSTAVTTEKLLTHEVSSEEATDSSVQSGVAALYKQEESTNEKTSHRVIVGNVSKYLPIESRQENDQSTHKWMVYVRGPREKPDISPFVSKVIFFLHPTYKPNDLVSVSIPPFHVTRRGWGEFPIRVQLHLKDARGRKVDIIHLLKLDQTYTGLQSLGAETHVDVEIEHKVLTSTPAIAVLEITKTVSDQTIKHSPTKKQSANLSKTDPNVKTEPQEPQPTDLYKATTSLNPKEEAMRAMDDVLAESKAVSRNSAIYHRTTYQDTSESIFINYQPPKKKIKQAAETNPAMKTFTVFKNNSSSHNVKSKRIVKRVLPQQVSLSATPKSPMISLLKPHSNGLSPVVLPKPNNLVIQRATEPSTVSHINAVQSQPLSSTAIKVLEPVYMKYQLKNGKVMLVRKDVADKIKVKTTTTVEVKPNIPLAKDRRKPASKPSRVIIRQCSPSEGAFSKSQVLKLPSLKQLRCLENLIEWLTAAHPLVAQTDNPSHNNSSCLLPKISVFLSWPIGKRRALEWKRAKSIREHLLMLSQKPDFYFSGLQHWSTKNIMIWCRNNLYSPCCPDNIPRSLSFTNTSPSKLTASNILMTSDNSEVRQAEDNSEVLVDVLSIKPGDNSISPSSTTGLISVSPSREEIFVANLVSQLGIQLTPTRVTDTLSAPITASVLSRLYVRFMERILRCSYSARTTRLSQSNGRENICELTNQDITDAVRSNDNLLFLDNIFVEYEESDDS